MFSRRLVFLHRKVLSEEDRYHAWCVSNPASVARTRACTGAWARWSTATAATARPGGRRSTRRSSSGPGTTRADTGEVARDFHDRRTIYILFILDIFNSRRYGVYGRGYSSYFNRYGGYSGYRPSYGYAYAKTSEDEAVVDTDTEDTKRE